MKRLAPVLMALMMFCLCGCSNIKNIRITGGTLSSVSPMGLRGAKATFNIGVDNPAMAFKLSDINGMIYYNGEPFIQYRAEDVQIDKKCVKSYPLNCTAELAGGVSLFSVLSLISKKDLEGVTADLHAKVSLKSGVYKNFDYKNIPVKSLLEQ